MFDYPRKKPFFLCYELASWKPNSNKRFYKKVFIFTLNPLRTLLANLDEINDRKFLFQTNVTPSCRKTEKTG